MIPKANGKKRWLGIPTMADRVVQAALKLVLEPIFEADFRPCSYGFCPNRRAHDVIAEIHHFATRGYEWVLEGDITACFDEIDHAALMSRVRARISDKLVLRLVKAFLKAGILSEDPVHRDTRTGTPHGGILSPLLANVALSVLDEHFAELWQRNRDVGRPGLVPPADLVEQLRPPCNRLAGCYSRGGPGIRSASVGVDHERCGQSGSTWSLVGGVALRRRGDPGRCPQWRTDPRRPGFRHRADRCRRLRALPK